MIHYDSSRLMLVDKVGESFSSRNHQGLLDIWRFAKRWGFDGPPRDGNCAARCRLESLLKHRWSAHDSVLSSGSGADTAPILFLYARLAKDDVSAPYPLLVKLDWADWCPEMEHWKSPLRWPCHAPSVQHKVRMAFSWRTHQVALWISNNESHRWNVPTHALSSPESLELMKICHEKGVVGRFDCSRLFLLDPVDPFGQSLRRWLPRVHGYQNSWRGDRLIVQELLLLCWLFQDHASGKDDDESAVSSCTKPVRTVLLEEYEESHSRNQACATVGSSSKTFVNERGETILRLFFWG